MCLFDMVTDEHKILPRHNLRLISRRDSPPLFFYSSQYDTLLEKGGFNTIHLGRLKNIAIETFKIINLNGQRPVYLNEFINVKEQAYSFRYANLLEIPRSRTSRYGSNSFRSAAAKVWNALPDFARTSTSFNDFSKIISAWNGFKVVVVVVVVVVI